MIPLRDIIPSRTTPFVTVCIIAVNAAAWIYELTLPEPALTGFIQTYGVVPSALDPSTFVTAMFLHGSWLHVIGIIASRSNDRPEHRPLRRKVRAGRDNWCPSF